MRLLKWRVAKCDVLVWTGPTEWGMCSICKEQLDSRSQDWTIPLFHFVPLIHTLHYSVQGTNKQNNHITVHELQNFFSGGAPTRGHFEIAPSGIGVLKKKGPTLPKILKYAGPYEYGNLDSMFKEIVVKQCLYFVISNSFARPVFSVFLSSISKRKESYKCNCSLFGCETFSH